MSTEGRAWILFACVLIVGAVAGGAWYALTTARYATYEIHTRDATSGLIADSPVEFHGVEVGKVTRVELMDAHSVRILLTVRKTAPVTRATVATITGRGLAPRGFMGYAYVALENTGDDSHPLTAAPGDQFPTIFATSSRLDSLDMTASQVGQDVQSMTELLRYVLDRNTILALKDSLDNLQKVSQTLADNNQRLSSLILNGQQASNRLNTLLESSNAAVATLRGQVLPQTYEALSRVKPLLDSSNEAVTALQTQVLPQTYDTLAELQSLSASLKSVATEVESDPSIIIRGRRTPAGPGERK